MVHLRVAQWVEDSCICIVLDMMRSAIVIISTPAIPPCGPDAWGKDPRCTITSWISCPEATVECLGTKSILALNVLITSMWVPPHQKESEHISLSRWFKLKNCGASNNNDELGHCKLREPTTTWIDDRNLPSSVLVGDSHLMVTDLSLLPFTPHHLP